MGDMNKLVNGITTSRVVFINMEHEVFIGSVLDVGMDHQGIIYNICKNSGSKMNVEYIDEEFDQENIKGQEYDNIVLFFTLGKINLQISRKALIKDLAKYLKEGGNIIIWDVDKPLGKVVNLNVNVVLPGKITKILDIKEFNILKESSAESSKRLLEPFFDIIEFKSKDNIYYIKGLKKGRTQDEGGTGSD